MTLRGRFVAYLVFLHLIFAALASALLMRQPLFLLAAEILFALSLITGITLARQMFRNLGFAAEGLRMLREEEFTSRFLEVGQSEVDELINVYNRMIDRLRDERTRLQEQHHFLSQILKVSPSGIVILDFDRRIVEVNPAAERLIGLPAGALIGKSLEDAESPLAAALAALEAGEADVVGLSGARRLKCHHGSFVDRGFRRSFYLIEELTEELRQFERAAYEKLIRVMSHEVNNSLAASNSLLHSCLHYQSELSAETRADFAGAIDVVIERTEQLNSFMRRFADVFRLPPPAKRPIELLPLLENSVRLASAKANASGVSWRFDVERGAPMIRLDRGQMEQVFLNILLNAAEAIDGSGEVTIRLQSRSGRALLQIDDTGAGLSAEAQTNLFTPFFSTKAHGQGIGLTLVQEILSAHGFSYSLERLPEGITRFTIGF